MLRTKTMIILGLLTALSTFTGLNLLVPKEDVLTQTDRASHPEELSSPTAIEI